MTTAVPFREIEMAPVDLDIERRENGTLILKTNIPLRKFDPNFLNALKTQAEEQPDKTYLAERRGKDRAWFHQSFARTWAQVQSVAQWLLDQDIEAGRTVLILSGNSVAHAMMKYGAMAAGIPACPVSINYSLLGGDFSRLKHVVGLVNPGVILVEQGEAFNAALEALDLSGCTIVSREPDSLKRTAVAYADVVTTPVRPALMDHIQSLDPDGDALYMLTSGSTGMPKAVIQTQRMIMTNIVQAHQLIGKALGWDDVNLDWLPWNHVSGAANKFAAAICGGTLYIDEGKPVPGLFEETVRNLKEISLPYFSNVPAGYALLADALEKDEALRETFFKKLRLLLFGGAGLPQPLYDKIQDMAVATVGHRIFITTGYGATETTSGCMLIHFDTDKVGIGLPCPGMAVKLVPLEDDRYEVRMKGWNIMPGYLNRPDLATEIFDREGYYKLGDSARFQNPDNPDEGLVFAGRLAEEFKLGSGTWVAGGSVRAAVIAALAPVVTDLLLCGSDRDELGVLAAAHLGGLREISGELSADIDDLKNHPTVVAYITRQLTAYNEAHPGNSKRIPRFRFLTELPRADQYELSDKGTINQALMTRNRADEIDSLYGDPPAADTLIFLKKK